LILLPLTSGCGAVLLGVGIVIGDALSDPGGGGPPPPPTVISVAPARRLDSPETLAVAVQIESGRRGRLAARVDYTLEGDTNVATPAEGKNPFSVESGVETTFLWAAGTDLSGGSAIVDLVVVPIENEREGTPFSEPGVVAGDTSPELIAVAGQQGLEFVMRRGQEVGDLFLDASFSVVDAESDPVCLVGVELAVDGSAFVPLPDDLVCGRSFSSGRQGVVHTFELRVRELDRPGLPDEIRLAGRAGFSGGVSLRLEFRQSQSRDPLDAACPSCELTGVLVALSGETILDNNEPPFVQLLPLDLEFPSSGIIPIRYRLFDPDRVRRGGSVDACDPEADPFHLAALRVRFRLAGEEKLWPAHELPAVPSRGSEDLITLSESCVADLASPVHVFLWDAVSQLAGVFDAIEVSVAAANSIEEDDESLPAVESVGPVSFTGLGRPLAVGLSGCGRITCPPERLVRADFDQDGFDDVVASLMGPAAIVHLRGGPNGLRFQGPLDTNGEVIDLGVGDFNRDGFPDLTALSTQSSDVLYFPGGSQGLCDDDMCRAGSGPCCQRNSRNLRSIERMAVADFTGDASLDVLAAGRGRDNLTLIEGSPLGLVRGSPTRDFPVGRGVLLLASGDLDGDGDADVIALRDAGGGAGELVHLRNVGGEALLVEAGRFGLGALPSALATGNFSGDGAADVAVGTEAGTVEVFLGGMGGGLAPLGPLAVAPGSRISALERADFDGGGFQDLAAASDGADTVSFLAGGLEGMRLQDAYRVGDEPAALASGDFDADGVLDLVTANAGSGSFTLLQGGPFGSAGDGGSAQTFGFRVLGDFAAGTEPAAVLSGDFNGDGVPDVAVAARGSESVAYALGGGAGLVSSSEVAPGINPQVLASGDFDADGTADLAAASASGPLVVLSGGPRGGSADRLRSIPVAEIPAAGVEALASADFDGDGIDDLALAVNEVKTIVLLGGGAGGLGTAPNRRQEISTALPFGELTLPRIPKVLASGDFNGDGTADLAVGLLDQAFGVAVLLGGQAGLEPQVLTAGCSPAADRPLECSLINVRRDPRGLLSCDQDGDGVDDLLVFTQQPSGQGNTRPGELSLLRGLRGVGLTAPAQDPLAVGDFPVAITAGDYDADGFCDAVVAAFSSREVHLVHGSTAGLAAPEVFGTLVDGEAVPLVPLALSSADYDSDGFLDVTVLCRRASDSGGVVIEMRGSPHGLSAARRLAAGREPDIGTLTNAAQALASADFDGDGFVDLATVNEGSSDVSVFRGGLRGLERLREHGAGDGPAAAVRGDFNGDAITDLAVANRLSGTVSYVRQRFLTPHASAFIVPPSPGAVPGGPAGPGGGAGGPVVLLDPRFPRRYRMEIASDAVSRPTQVAVLPTPAFPIDGVRSSEALPQIRAARDGRRSETLLVELPRPVRRVVTDAVRILPEAATLRRQAFLSLRLRDHDEELLARALEAPQRLRVFHQAPGTTAGLRLSVQSEIVEFEGAPGVRFPVERFGAYLVAVEEPRDGPPVELKK
jgi:hypothetical protein